MTFSILAIAISVAALLGVIILIRSLQRRYTAQPRRRSSDSDSYHGQSYDSSSPSDYGSSPAPYIGAAAIGATAAAQRGDDSSGWGSTHGGSGGWDNGGGGGGGWGSDSGGGGGWDSGGDSGGGGDGGGGE